MTRPLAVRTIDTLTRTPLPAVAIYAHRADGTLIGQGVTDTKGEGTIAVEDGGFVSGTFLRPETPGNPSLDQTQTIAVTPDLEIAPLGLGGRIIQEGPSMPDVNVGVEAPVDGTSFYVAWSSCDLGNLVLSTSETVHFDALRTCPHATAAPALGAEGLDALAWTLSQPQQGGAVETWLGAAEGDGYVLWSLLQPAAASGTRPRMLEWPDVRAATMAALEGPDVVVRLWAHGSSETPRAYEETIASRFEPGRMTSAYRQRCWP